MVFVETQFYKAWEAYDKATQHRFYTYAHALILVLLYEGLLFVSFNPNVYLYNGSDLWFYVSRFLPGGTIAISMALLTIWGNRLYLDWMGKKSSKERRKDYQDSKKIPRFKPKPKRPFRPNWYYFGMQVVEGFVWAALILMLLPGIAYLFMSIGSPDWRVTTPSPIDTNNVLKSFHTNFVQNIALAFGAGFYEEVIFRGYLFAGLAWLAGKVKWMKPLKAESVKVDVVKFSLPKIKPKDKGFLLVLLVGTLIYSVSHFLPTVGDIWNNYAFFYRFLFGLIMFYIFYQRRLVVAAWTHAFYDLWYFLLF